ncbi:2-amino-4-hydroxy-6-hydroxymethyldihydropteridine diphosphokinase [Catenuloplanes atrovinosus]|uniref:2-amino-4-hydroxy-6-hydroxymethyldihydropteridine diphosphokinase n=1 Tax=Catenuloplanes atrovinosus TaxID=137266 RepID=A0AAE3YUT5_9ACTN|nr:2-amino-4-hydroxy-6-hydroxymethyldihydropteridine diphosphokinase [Catenuloplanes atrovinosus]MDR7280298.1 2-amino-4-hydroxy-6-hydroxymethyldihydropteridine diphosphokinase [Catenuloplanes atrovinosus]
MTRALLSIGGNLGDRLAHLRAAVAGLGDTVLVVSGVYETPPWGDADQPSYLNAAVMVAAPDRGPRDWLETAWRLEAEAGRTRDPERRFGPRTLDVDVIAVWADDGTPVLSDDERLTLPHPRAHLRAFVLRPWIDIDPFGAVPGHGSLDVLLREGPAAADAGGIQPRPDLTLEFSR